jgi:outer membrane protein TolC
MKKLFLYVIIASLILAASGDRASAAPDNKTEPSPSEMARMEAKGPLTLDECYQLALKQSELIAIDAERIKQAEAHFLSAFEGLLPEVSFNRVDARQNSKMSPLNNHGFDQKFVFSQALFTGFKEYAGMVSGHYETKQRKYGKIRAEQLLFQDVSDAFYLLIEKREDLKALETIRRALVSRVKELNERVNIGKSRNSEVVFTESQMYNLESTMEFIKGQELIARELLEFLVGRRLGEIVETEIKFDIKPEPEYLKEGYSRSDVEAAKYAWKSDEKQIMVTESGFLPQINLEASRYGHRSSSPEDARWDAMLTVDVPLFEEHTTFGAVKEAIATARSSELMFHRVKRIALQEIHNAYVNMNSSLAVYMALEKALSAAEENYSLQTKDYQISVVNNLDVLTAIQNLGDVKRAHVQALYETKRFYWRLLVAAGEVGGDAK